MEAKRTALHAVRSTSFGSSCSITKSRRKKERGHAVAARPHHRMHSCVDGEMLNAACRQIMWRFVSGDGSSLVRSVPDGTCMRNMPSII